MARVREGRAFLVSVSALAGSLGCTVDDSLLGGRLEVTGAKQSGGSDAAGGATGGQPGANEGGTSAQGGSSTGGQNGQGGSTASGGLNGQGGSPTGGRNGQGGSTASGGMAQGIASGGSAAGAGGGATCTPPRPAVFCANDEECGETEYCAAACAPSACFCRDGSLLCTTDCRNACSPLSTDCAPATPAFTSQLSGERCTVIVRVLAESTRIAGYAVDCGPESPVTESQALNTLLPMSSINWSGATRVGNAEFTGVHTFKTVFSGSLYTGFISASTGHLLAITEVPPNGAPGRFRSPSVWREGAELGQSCSPDRPQSFAAFAIEGTDFQPAVAEKRVQESALFDALRAKFGQVGATAITNSDPQQTEYLAFVSAP